MCVGAMLGGTVIGWLSQSVGRRLTIIVMCFMGGALIYPYTYVTSEKVMAVAFFEQFAVQGRYHFCHHLPLTVAGAWGVIPIHLTELSPGSFRTFVVGTSYQLGNLASSASATIEAKLGEQYPLPPLKGVARYQYGRAMCIFCGAVFAYIILITLVGPEYLGRRFDAAGDHDFETAVGGHEVVDRALHPDGPPAGADTPNGEKVSNGEKKTEAVV
jgi:MFS transporter, SHS family, lactate transporter